MTPQANPEHPVKYGKLKIAAAVAVLFTGLVAAIIYLLAKQAITFQMALLMFIGLLGFYFGFGVLIAVYRFVAKLD